MDDQQNSLHLLEQSHQFPGPFVFKVIGENSPEFAQRAYAAIAGVVAPTVPTQPTVRHSAAGKHQALSFTVEVLSAQQVLQVYGALQALDGMHYVL